MEDTGCPKTDGVLKKKFNKKAENDRNEPFIEFHLGN